MTQINQSIVRAMHSTFNSESGMQVLGHLQTLCKVFDTTYTQGDPYHTAFLEGQRRVVLDIMKYLAIRTDDDDKRGEHHYDT